MKVRLIVWYIGSIGALAFLPFLSLILEQRGWSTLAIVGTLVLVPVGILSGAPAWAWLADRTRAPHLCLRAATALTLLTGVILATTNQPAVLVTALAVHALSRSALSPLGDALCVGLLGDDRRSYGAVRAWGSGAFLVVVLSGGALRDTVASAPIWLAVVPMTLAAIVSWTLPAAPAVVRTARLADMRSLLSDRWLLAALVLAWLQGTTLTAYDNFFGLHADRAGVSGLGIGLALALGVGAEIAVMLTARRLLDRFGPAAVLVAAVGAGVPRWALTALAPSAALLVATQALHGLTFGAFWVAGVALFSERAPAELRSTAQAMWTASAFGLGYLTAMGTSAVALSFAGTTALFATTTVIATCATALAVALWITDRPRPSRS